MIQIEPSWHALLARLAADSAWRSIVVLGPVDAGKTTLCRFLGAELARHYRTAALDCDPGQSVIGPPATIGVGWEPWDGGNPFALRFVGSTTPVGHFLQTLTGIKRLADRAIEDGAQKVVCDSSGYIATGAGREFHFQVLDLLEPDHVVAIQRNDEIEPLLANFVRRTKPHIHRMPVSRGAISRTRTERQSYRHGRYTDYFAAALPHRLPLDGIGLHGMIPAFDNPRNYHNRLIALCDRRGFAAVVGIVEEVNLKQAWLQIYAPPFEREQIASVQFGSIHLDRLGRERGVW